MFDTWHTILGITTTLAVGAGAWTFFSASPDVDREPEKEEPRTPPFSHKFTTEFRELTVGSVAEDMEDVAGKDVTIDTPRGSVTMEFRGPDPGIFAYWSANKDIPYCDLETIARHFCIEHNCRSLCIDTPAELMKALDKQRQAEDKGDDASKADEGVFVVTKKYNVGRGGRVRKKGSSVCPASANQFKYMGDSKQPVKETVVAPSFSYSDWKNDVAQSTAED